MYVDDAPTRWLATFRAASFFALTAVGGYLVMSGLGVAFATDQPVIRNHVLILIVPFIAWQLLLTYFAAAAVFGGRHLWLAVELPACCVLGNVVGFISGASIASYGGMFVGAGIGLVIGPFVGIFRWCLRPSPYADVNS